MRIRLSLLVMLSVVLIACRQGRLSSAQMQQKLDSIARLENLEQLEARGIHLNKDVSPIQLFFDSLNIQPLPIRYSDEYVKYLPNYKSVPYELVSFMNLEGRTDPKAIALPETAGTRMVILAADEGDGLYSLWLYSLDTDYLPTDKLCLYATNKEEQKENEDALPEDKLIQDFVITSDYEIRLTDYTGKYKAQMQKVYHVDMSRKFVEAEEIDYEEKTDSEAD